MVSKADSGYDLHWVEDPPDDLKCLICLYVARDPQQHPGDARNPCGKVFCIDCIAEYQRRDKSCPNCRQELNLFQDSRSDRAVKTLKVMCSNEKKGCNWAGELGSLETHRFMCDHEFVSYKYAAVGCEEKPLRKDLTEHENDSQLHLQITTEKVLELTKNVQTLTKTNSLISGLTRKYLELTKNFQKLTKVTSKAFNLTPCTFKLTDYQQLKNGNKGFYSPSFLTSYLGYKMCLLVDANGEGSGAGTHVSVYAHLMKGDHDDTLTWPFTGSVTFELLNQLEDKNHYKLTITFQADKANSKRVVDGERGIGWGYSQFISHTALDYNASTNTQYLKDDTLVFRVSVEVPDNKPWLDCTM